MLAIFWGNYESLELSNLLSLKAEKYSFLEYPCLGAGCLEAEKAWLVQMKQYIHASKWFPHWKLIRLKSHLWKPSGPHAVCRHQEAKTWPMVVQHQND